MNWRAGIRDLVSSRFQPLGPGGGAVCKSVDRSLLKRLALKLAMAFTCVISIFTMTVILASPLQPAFGAANDHWTYLASVATYKPRAGFNHVVGPTRFVGYFLPAPDRCLVTIFQSAANDEALVTPPRRFEINILAGGRSDFDAGEGSALAIACTVDADAIKIAPQHRPMSAISQ